MEVRKDAVEVVINAPSRVISLVGASNFRDLGGYLTQDYRRVKWRKLFRSADLSKVTKEDKTKLASLELAWIFDLRTAKERASHPTPSLGKEINEHLSFLDAADPYAIFQQKSSLNEELLVELNRQMAHRIEVLQSFVRRWLSLEGKSFLFHCMAGKDRTGFIGAFILRTLGVGLESIKQDYMLTNTYWRKELLNGEVDQFHTVDPAIAQALLEAREAYIIAAMNEIDDHFGGFEAYWKDALGFSVAELNQLREHYLE